MEHTKGEWKVTKKDNSTVIIRKASPLTYIAIIIGGISTEEMMANARLIAAAPDLLEACKYTIEKMRGIKGRAFPILPIIKAIAKAKAK